MKRYKEIPNVPTPVGSYCPATTCGNMIYLAGQIGLNPETGVLDCYDVKNQTTQVMNNVKAVLDFLGSDTAHILQTTIFLADITQASVVNAAYEEFFEEGEYPARQTVAVKDLPMNAKVEITVIACKKEE